MPLQLFREPHPPRSKSTVLTVFRMRIGSALRRLTTPSPLVRVNSPYFWMYMHLHKVKFNISGSDCDFIGAQGVPDMMFAHCSTVDQIPEKMVCVANGELIITAVRVLFFLNSSPAHSSLLVTWANWDNSLIVRSTAYDSPPIRLHSHPLNRVGILHHQ